MRIPTGTASFFKTMNLSRGLPPSQQAYYTFGGDLNQMGRIADFLKNHGYKISYSESGFPGFLKEEQEQFKAALHTIWKYKPHGWWSQALVENNICTQEEYGAALIKMN